MASCSDRGVTGTARSPAAIRSATPTISFKAPTIRSNARASAPISSRRESDVACPARSPVAIRLALATTCPRLTVTSRMMKKPMTDTARRPRTAHASACSDLALKHRDADVQQRVQRAADLLAHARKSSRCFGSSSSRAPAHWCLPCDRRPASPCAGRRPGPARQWSAHTSRCRRAALAFRLLPSDSSTLCCTNPTRIDRWFNSSNCSVVPCLAAAMAVPSPRARANSSDQFGRLENEHVHQVVARDVWIKGEVRPVADIRDQRDRGVRSPSCAAGSSDRQAGLD